MLKPPIGDAAEQTHDNYRGVVRQVSRSYIKLIRPKAVFGFTKLTLGMVHWNFNGTAGGKMIRNRDTVLRSDGMQHRIDTMTR